jgi:hypothetical protein
VIVFALAKTAVESRRRFTAASSHPRACTYYQMGERFRTPKDARALEAFRAGVDCFQRFSRLTDCPRIDIVEIPYENASLPAYFVQ